MNMKRILIIMLIFLIIPVSSKVDDRLDINRAGARDFTILPGINHALANEIIEYRRNTGGFKTIEELIPIIGENIFENIRYDIMITPLEELEKGTLSGRISFSFARDTDNLDSTPFNMSINFNQGETFTGYLSQDMYEISYGQTRLKDSVGRSFTYYIYDYIQAVEERKEIFEPQVFKVITAEEQRDKFAEITEELSRKYGARLSIKDDDRYVKGHFESNPSYIDYFKHPETRSSAVSEEEELPLYIIDEVEYTRQNKERVENIIDEKEFEEIAEEEEAKRNIKRVLRHKFDLGDISSPYVRAARYSPRGLGFSYETYFDDNDLQLFYIDAEFRDYINPLYGMKFERDIDDTRVGTMLYRLSYNEYGNNFDHFMLFGEKSIDSNTNLYMEYGTVFNKVDSYYVRADTRYNNINIRKTLDVKKASYDNQNDLEPFGTFYWSVPVAVDSINPSIRLDYFLPDKNRLIIDRSYLESSNYDSQGRLRESNSTSTSFTYRYNPSDNIRTDWTLSFDEQTRKGQGGWSDGERLEYTTGSILFRYSPDRDLTLSAGFDRESDNESAGNYLNEFDYRLFYRLHDTTTVRLETTAERPPGQSKFREIRFQMDHDFSSDLSMRFKNRRQFTNSSSGERSYYRWTELSFRYNF
ncbi:MAG: helix-hairpin-helix domain-containing protein [Candidatus Muiribacteriota bacterium]